MKTRIGFVSNSSSSSFVISANNHLFKTVADIAFYMIPKRGWEDDQKVMNNIRTQISLGMSPDHPISFRSCNYDTFIVKQDDVFYISTCNNHDWEFTICNNNNWECISGVSMSHDDEQEHYILCEMPYLFKYYNASYGVTGWIYGQKDRDGYYSYEYCKECITDLWVCDGGAPFCPECGKKSYEVDAFEVWWKTYPINNTTIPEAQKNAWKEVAKAAWDAAKKNL